MPAVAYVAIITDGCGAIKMPLQKTSSARDGKKNAEIGLMLQ
jgi:hypothetical protein